VPELKIKIAAEQHYSCLLCGRCCKRFHVLLRPGEAERLEQLDWGPEGKPACADHFHGRIGGYPYFLRRDDGACVFLDDHGCLMHRRLGYDVKALTCRGYPLNYISTFPGEISVLARMDCPAVLQNHGELLQKDRVNIAKIASELHFGQGFTRQQLQGLERPSLDFILDSLRQLIRQPQLPMGQLMLHLCTLTTRLSKLGPIFLNDLPVLKEVMPSTVAATATEADDWPRLPLSAFSRACFRTWLHLYCLRDGEIVDRGLRTRLRRVWAALAIISGHGNLRGHSTEHPDFPLARAKMFAQPYNEAAMDPELWECYRRFLDVRLECYQFFGEAFYRADFFTGLQVLFSTFPLVLVLARLEAASRQLEIPDAQSVMYAVGAVDNAHGRGSNLRLPIARHLEQYFALPRMVYLLYSLGALQQACQRVPQP